MSAAVHFSSAKSDWETPDDLFAALHAEFGFDLDVCAHEGNHKLPQYLSPADDSLAQEWRGACWMNPPYGRQIAKWVRAARLRSISGQCTVVALLPARTDTAWWHDWIWDEERNEPRPGVEVRLLRGRLRFKGAQHSAPFPSAVIVFGQPKQGVTLRRPVYRAPNEIPVYPLPSEGCTCLVCRNKRRLLALKEKQL